ncbi:MAG: pyridoxamine 5'-phosphate oxidase family protein [Bacteroidota bacterium]
MIITANAQPLELLSNCWKELRRGTVDRRHPFRFVTLASVRDKSPVQRTVVCRSISEQRHFLIYTDLRSGKCSEFEVNDIASLLFYHPQKQLQISCHCKVRIETDTDQTQTIWKAFPDHQKKDYNRLKDPGEALTAPQEGWDLKVNSGYQNFALIHCIPEKMDVLQLSRDGHLRLQFWQDDTAQWQGQWVAP